MGKIAPAPRQPPGPRPVATGRDLGRPPSDSPSPQAAHPAPRPRLTGRIAPARPAQPPSGVSINALLTNPALLGRDFASASWDRWKSVCRAAFAEPLSPRDRKLFAEAAGGRAPPKRRVRELWAKIGRGGGKSATAAAIATHAAIKDYTKHLRPGERGTVLVIACDKDQAQVVLGYIRGNFASSPALAALVENETQQGLELKNRVDIVVAPPSYRTVRGKTLVAVVFDEAAFFRDESSAAPDIELYRAVGPGLARIPGSILIGISTPWMTSGLFYDKITAAFGKNDDNVLAVAGATLDFNSEFDKSAIADAMREDEIAARSEYGGEWRLDLSYFIDRALIDASTDKNVTVRAPEAGVSYCAFCDASSGRGDSFVVCVSHLDDKRIVVDALAEWRPPFDPAMVVREAAALLRQYNCTSVTGDRYAVGFTSSLFSESGVSYLEKVVVKGEDGAEQALDRSGLYLRALPYFTSGQVRLLDNQRMARQFAALERRAYPTGKDVVRHPDGQHDDLANAVAGAVVVTALSAGDSMPVWRKSASGLQDFENELLGPPRRVAVEPPPTGPGQSSFAEAAQIVRERMRGKR